MSPSLTRRGHCTFFLKDLFCFLTLLCVCVQVCVHEFRCPWESEQDARSWGLKLKAARRHLDLDLNLDHLQQQCMLLTNKQAISTAPVLQFFNKFSKKLKTLGAKIFPPYFCYPLAVIQHFILLQTTNKYFNFSRTYDFVTNRNDKYCHITSHSFQRTQNSISVCLFGSTVIISPEAFISPGALIAQRIWKVDMLLCCMFLMRLSVLLFSCEILWIHCALSQPPSTIASWALYAVCRVPDPCVHRGN